MATVNGRVYTGTDQQFMDELVAEIERLRAAILALGGRV